jgi:hypothetical protein
MASIPTLAVLIAAKDESITITDVVERHFETMSKFTKHVNWMIGVLNDGSLDDTELLLTKLKSEHPQLVLWKNDKPSGIAEAFRQLSINAHSEWVYITSGDGQFTADGLEQMINQWLVNPITTLGIRSSRFETYGFMRKLSSKGFRVVSKTLFGVDLIDPGSVKIIKRDTSIMNFRSKSTMRDAEMLAFAHHNSGGIQFVEIPFLKRIGGKANGVTIRNLALNARDIFFLFIKRS